MAAEVTEVTEVAGLVHHSLCISSRRKGHYERKVEGRVKRSVEPFFEGE